MSTVPVTDATFQTEVLQADLPVLVDFWAPWCGPCRMLHPVLEKLAEKHAGRLTVLKVNVDVNQVWASQLKVRGIPALFFFRDGQPVGAVAGYQDERTLDRQVTGLLQAA